MRHSSTSTYIPNFVEIEETILDGRTDRHLRPTVLCRLGGVDLIQHVPVAAVYLFSLEFLLQSFALGNLSRRQFLLRLTVLTHQLIQLAVVCSQQHLATHHHFTNLVTGSCSLMIVFSTKPRDWLGRTSLEWPILCRVGRKTLTQWISHGKPHPTHQKSHKFTSERLIPISSKIVKVKASHTCNQALGPQLIPVYRQSARRSSTRR